MPRYLKPEGRRLAAADLFAKGTKYGQVASALGVTEEAARRWWHRWKEGGKAALKEKSEGRRGPPAPATDDQVHALMTAARQQKLATMTALYELAQRRKVPGSRSALRRHLIALGYWPAGDSD